MITDIAFDFDGTLVDSRAAAFEAFNRLADEEGFSRLTVENLAAMRKLSILERCRVLGISPLKLPALMMQAGRLYREASGSVEFYSGIPELLRALARRGLRLAIVSSNEERIIRPFLDRAGLSELVRDVRTSPRIFGKARMINRLLKERRAKPGEFVYVGDEHRDIVAAREARVRMIGVTWGFDDAELLREARPDAVAQVPGDIETHVEAWSRG